MARVLAHLLDHRGFLVTRAELVANCWNGLPVGDDSINRAIAGIRRAARAIGADELQIDTIAGAGYTVREGPPRGNLDDALEDGWRAWRRGLPRPEGEAIAAVRLATHDRPDLADGWGMLALLLREAVEYAEAGECAALVEECHRAVVKALSIDPHEPNAIAARISLPPLFGDWAARREQLVAALQQSPDHVPLRHDLAILEMATGRASAATPILIELLEQDPLAARFHYKRIYHLWTAGELAAMDRFADRSMQLWPHHPAIWFARLWSLAFTGRPAQALQQLADEARPPIPPPALANLLATVEALLDPQRTAAAVESNLAAARRGPAQSVHAIIHLAGLGAIDEALEVAQGYFLRRGPVAVGVRKGASDPAINDQHRRVTQMLFIPATAALRGDPRFGTLCEEIGLSDYWRLAGVRPDFADGPT